MACRANSPLLCLRRLWRLEGDCGEELNSLMLMVGASGFVALLHSLTVLVMLDIDGRPVVGKLVLLPALLALLFIVAFGYSNLAKAPLQVNTAVSSIGRLFTMFYLVLSLISWEPFVCCSLRRILRDGLS